MYKKETLGALKRYKGLGYSQALYRFHSILTFLTFLSLAYIKHSCAWEGNKERESCIFSFECGPTESKWLVVNAADAREINNRQVFRYANWC